jgi:hypothetical protein
MRAQKARSAYTARVLLDQWQSKRLADRSAGYRREAPRRLRVALANWLDLPAGDLTHADAVAILEKAKSSVGPVQANRIRAYARAAFNWSVQCGSLGLNPFAKIHRCT